MVLLRHIIGKRYCMHIAIIRGPGLLIQSGTVITRSVFYTILTIDTPELARWWVIIVRMKLDTRSATVIAVPYVISFRVGSCYSGTGWYTIRH